MMTIFDNPALTRVLTIAAAGVVIGFLFSIGSGLNTLIWKYKRDAVTVPKAELLPAIVMAFAPITKVLYAFIAASVLAQRNLANSELSIVATFAGGAFALIAVVQGAWAAKLINTPTAKEGLLGTFPFKMAMLGSIETLAVFALVGTLVFATRLAA
jgi:hypothetical protein